MNSMPLPHVKTRGLSASRSAIVVDAGGSTGTVDALSYVSVFRRLRQIDSRYYTLLRRQISSANFVGKFRRRIIVSSGLAIPDRPSCFNLRHAARHPHEGFPVIAGSVVRFSMAPRLLQTSTIRQFVSSVLRPTCSNLPGKAFNNG